MMIEKEIEEIVLKANMVTEMNILITDDKKVVYYIGDTEKCKKYLYSEISEDIKKLTTENANLDIFTGDKLMKILNNDSEEYCCQVFYPFYQESNLKKCIVFYKENEMFTEKEIFIMNSTIYLIKKYLNKD